MLSAQAMVVFDAFINPITMQTMEGEYHIFYNYRCGRYRFVLLKDIWSIIETGCWGVLMATWSRLGLSGSTSKRWFALETLEVFKLKASGLLSLLSNNW
jgi:hypothetical protein